MSRLWEGDYDFVTSEEVKENGDRIQLETGFEDRRFRSPHLTGAFMQVDLDDGRRFTDRVLDGKTQHSAYVPTDEVKMDVREAGKNMRGKLHIDDVYSQKHFVSPLVLTDDKIEAQIRSSGSGKKKGTFTSYHDEELDSPVIGIEDWSLKNNRGYREEIRHLSDSYGIATDVDELIPSIEEVKREI